jgi:N-acetylmuramoyl-L-alanine amidase
MGRKAALALMGMLLLGAPLGAVPVQAGGQDLAGKVIALDAGHGGSDPGASGFGLLEKDVNLDVVLRARDLLAAEGATVVLTRDCDCTVSLADRVAKANGANADRFVSVHSNACGGCGGKGTETYYHTSLGSGSTAAQLASVVQQEAVEHLQTTDRGVKQADFYVLRNTAMPAVLLELAFIDHAGDNAKLASPTWRQEAARGILHAVQRHYGIPPHDPGSPFLVAIAAPTQGAWVGGVVQARGTTNQEGNLAWMRFLLDGAVAKWVTPVPHVWDWDTRATSDGAHALRLEGRNAQGQDAHHAITVNVDNTPPDAAITSPREGMVHVGGNRLPGAGLTIAAGRVPFEATATDPAPGSGVARVDFLVDGVLRHRATAAPYAWTWPAEDEALGNHDLAIVAVDRVGNARTLAMEVDLTVPTTPRGLLASA